MAAVIDEYLHELVLVGASDLHLKAGHRPTMRLQGDLKRMDFPVLSPEDYHSMIMELLNEDRRERLNNFKEVDLSYNVPGLARFRVNLFWQRGQIGAVFRVIPFLIKTIDELEMPEVCKSLALLPRGLILVTGPTGSGKSTSLAAIVDYINTTKRLHVMTVEDPIEYVHTDKMSVINQRELATDTHTFTDALRHVMRQNPDVILVGEMRDLETIQLAITAAETGHLVFSTLHTVDSAQTIDRIVDVFPPDQQAQIRTQLSITLQGIVSQTLLPLTSGDGRVAAFEVMVATPAIRTIIRDGKTHALYHDLQTGAALGMQTLDGSLIRLLQQQKIDYEHALAKCSNPPEFRRRAESLGLAEVLAAAN